jgi:hypothetical protein
MNQYIDRFDLFENLGFDRFMRQAQVAQSGNPYWFGRNPKPKAKTKSTLIKKKKS